MVELLRTILCHLRSGMVFNMALVQYTGKNVFGVFVGAGEAMRLLPGVNEVSDNHLEMSQKLPLFQHRVRNGQILILKSTLGKDGKRSVEDMLDNIPKIFDLKLLKKIIESDGRDQVVKAANSQVESIKNPAKEKELGSEHFK